MSDYRDRRAAWTNNAAPHDGAESDLSIQNPLARWLGLSGLDRPFPGDPCPWSRTVSGRHTAG
jgi:hypothetical protein